MGRGALPRGIRNPSQARGNGMLWFWGAAGNPRGPLPLLRSDPGPRQWPLHGAPRSWALWALATTSPVCVSFSSVISMRCMVQFVGREAKYRWVILPGLAGVACHHSVCQDRLCWGQLLSLFYPGSNALAEERGSGQHRRYPGGVSSLLSLSCVRPVSGAALDNPGSPAEG